MQKSVKTAKLFCLETLMVYINILALTAKIRLVSWRAPDNVVVLSEVTRVEDVRYEQWLISSHVT